MNFWQRSGISIIILETQRDHGQGAFFTILQARCHTLTVYLRLPMMPVMDRESIY
jgi:hypothetical protein